MESILFLPPWPNWMKSSTKTSVVARGLLRGLFEGGASFSSSSALKGIPNARFAAASSSSRGLGTIEGERSSWAAATSSIR